MLVRNILKVRCMCNGSSIRRLSATNRSLAECNKAFENFKLNQAKMQCDDGRPVFLKAGSRDEILFKVALGLTLLSTISSICTLVGLKRKFG